MLQSFSVKPIYQVLHLIYGYLFFRSVETVFEEEKNKNKEGNRRDRNDDRNDEILGSDLAFVG